MTSDGPLAGGTAVALIADPMVDDDRVKLSRAQAIVEFVISTAPGPVSVYVVDAHGELVAAASMDGAAPDTRLNAQRKAYTAARSDARDHAEERGHRRRFAQRLHRDAGGVGRLGVRPRQLVGAEHERLEEDEGGTKLGPKRRTSPVGGDRLPAVLTERVRRDRAVGARSEWTLVEQ